MWNTEEDAPGELGNLPNLSARLEQIEAEYIDNPDQSMIGARSTLVEAARSFRNSRYRFGEALASYKKQFIKTRGWIQAAKAIAEEAALDERTIRRVIEDYERASRLSTNAIAALEAAGVDPGAKKNLELVEAVERMPDDPGLPAAVANAAAAVRTAKRTAMSKPSTQSRAIPEAPATNQRVPSFPVTETARDVTRRMIRNWLNNVPTSEKLKQLQLLIEEEMYDWGERNCKMILFTPRPSAQASSATSICQAA